MVSIADRMGARALRTRWVVRAPIWLYRHRLGWMLGGRVLMLQHVGRRTGRERFVCLEVIERPEPDRVVVVSGFGARAQWYRNLAANPSCRVSVGFRVDAEAHARMMTATEAEAALKRYQMRHPRAWKRLRGVIEEAVGAPVAALPMVELSLIDH